MLADRRRQHLSERDLLPDAAHQFLSSESGMHSPLEFWRPLRDDGRILRRLDEIAPLRLAELIEHDGRELRIGRERREKLLHDRIEFFQNLRRHRLDRVQSLSDRGHEGIIADALEGPANHPRDDDAEERHLRDLIDDRGGDRLRLVHEHCEPEVGHAHAVAAERVDRRRIVFREEGAAIHPIGEVRLEDQHCRAAPASDEFLGLGAVGDDFETNVLSSREVVDHDLGPRLLGKRLPGLQPRVQIHDRRCAAARPASRRNLLPATGQARG